MNDKYVFGLVVIATTIFATMSIVSDVLVGSSGAHSASLTYNTEVCIDVNGKRIGCSPNLVTNVGKEFLEGCLGQGGCGTPTAFTTLALANCTNGVAVGDTTLCNGQVWSTCGLGQQAGTYVNFGIGQWNVTYTWTSSCDNAIVNATGMYNSTHLFAENIFTSVTLQTNDQINVTWGIWVT
ncbi:MAG: hypothetical protein ABIE55_03015 [Candidatus Aenigmatarchaeota archaeon]